MPRALASGQLFGSGQRAQGLSRPIRSAVVCVLVLFVAVNVVDADSRVPATRALAAAAGTVTARVLVIVALTEATVGGIRTVLVLAL